MKDTFNNFYWHDANIKFIHIDRSKPGENDVVSFLIDWPDEISSSIIEFYDCYGLDMNFNFGIIACESILSAECLDRSKSPKLQSIYEKWRKIEVNLDNLMCFQINTNSTNSVINIYALGFRLIDA